MRAAIAPVLLGVLVAATASGVGFGAPAAPQGASPAQIYATQCASCHEGGAVARAPARDVIAALPADRIVAALETGIMRVQGEALTPADRRAVAAYLSTARPAAGAPSTLAP